MSTTKVVDTIDDAERHTLYVNVHTQPGMCLVMAEDLRGSLAHAVGRVELLEWRQNDDGAFFSDPQHGPIEWAPGFKPKPGQRLRLRVVGLESPHFYAQVEKERVAQPVNINEHSPTHYIFQDVADEPEEMVVGQAWVFANNPIRLRMSDEHGFHDYRLVHNNY